ncbi:MAG: ATP-binding cassette domain-containing protein [Zoogloeaceae bacterium]|jgi:putative ABC transport system ATP-binding protein|nr:ATP-binding cassette domain-containing protein [Zoogloeaceae bacterium]
MVSVRETSAANRADIAPSPPASLQYALTMRDMTFAWEQATPCLQVERFALSAQEQLFLYGPSGSGKSTFLNLAAGVLTPDHGSICLLGENLGALSAIGRDRFRVDHVGFVFQNFNLIPWMSVLENTLLPCRFSRRRRQRASQATSPEAEAARLLRALDLERNLWGQPAMKLSVGQQQRVAVARALLGRPEIIIADEPTSSLDANRQAIFLELLQNECASSGAALLFVSHDERLAARFHRTVHLPELNRIDVGEKP